MRTLHINCEKQQGQKSWVKKEYLLEAAKRLGFDFVKDSKVDGDPKDYVLNVQPCEVSIGGEWTGLWHIDVSLSSPLINFYNEVDTLFVASSVGILPHPKQTVLFQACDPTFYDPLIPKQHDFVFCGSRGPIDIYYERDRIYSLLEKKYDCITIEKGKEPKLYTDIISQARIQIVQPCMDKAKWGMCAQRFFECLAIGPVLCDYTPDLELLGLVEGRDYMSYKNDRELIHKTNLLLSDEPLRMRIAKSGRTQALMQHTYDHRLVSIINLLKEHYNFDKP